MFRDVTEKRRMARDIAHRASHDWLTGLFNRAEFEARLGEVLHAPKRRKGSTLLFVDLDHFKRVNDSLGHAAGDALLRDLANLMRQILPYGCIVGRLGADEFGIILEHPNADASLALAQRLCDAITGHRVRLGSKITDGRIGASIGVVQLGTEFTSVGEAIRRADIAAYTAKSNGRGQVVVWAHSDISMQKISRQASLVTQLEQALRYEAFEIHAQRIAPIAPGETLELSELLIRLRDRDGGLIMPGDFIPAAERYGLAPRLDLWMVEKALDLIRSGAGTSRHMGFGQSVGRSLSSLSFQDDLLRLLDRTPKVTARRLCVEITETCVVENLAAASHLLTRLQAKGIKVALDDFGAGASSFRYLGDLPLDFLKTTAIS